MNIDDLREEFNPLPGGLLYKLILEYQRLQENELDAAAELEPVKTEWTRLREIASNRKPPFHTQRESEVALSAANDLFDEFQELRARLTNIRARQGVLVDRLTRIAESLRASKNDLAILESEAAKVGAAALVRESGRGQYSPHREAMALRESINTMLGVQRQ